MGAVKTLHGGDYGGIDITLEASAAISQYYCVITSGTDGEVKHATAAASDAVIGVAQEAAAADGDKVRVRVSGITQVKAGGVCTFGEFLMVDDATVGTVIDQTSTNHVIGIALATAADGDIIPMLITQSASG
jgi:hypothetical protein